MKFLEHETIKIEEIKEKKIFVFGGHKKMHLAFKQNGNIYGFPNALKNYKLDLNSVKPLCETEFYIEEKESALLYFSTDWFKRFKEDLINKRAAYTAAVLTHESGLMLYNQVKQYIPDGWDILCHHMTICLGEPVDEIKCYLGKKASLTIEGIGIDEELMVMAVSVNTNLFSKNKLKHITVALDLSNGAKAKNSNSISKFKPLDEKITLEAYVDVITQSKESRYNIKSFKH